MPRLVHVVGGHPRPGDVLRQIHDPLGRAAQLVKRLWQSAPELLPVQLEVVGVRAREVRHRRRRRAGGHGFMMAGGEVVQALV